MRPRMRGLCFSVRSSDALLVYYAPVLKKPRGRPPQGRLEKDIMCNCCEKSDLSRLTPVFEAFAGDDHALISILQKAQEIYGYLPTDVLYAIAEKTGNSPARTEDVCGPSLSV